MLTRKNLLHKARKFNEFKFTYYTEKQSKILKQEYHQNVNKKS